MPAKAGGGVGRERRLLRSGSAPLGLAMSKGAVLAASKQMSGGVLSSDGERAQPFPAETYEVADGGTFAIQCRLRLSSTARPTSRPTTASARGAHRVVPRDGGKADRRRDHSRQRRRREPGPVALRARAVLHRSGCESARISTVRPPAWPGAKTAASSPRASCRRPSRHRLPRDPGAMSYVDRHERALLGTHDTRVAAHGHKSGEFSVIAGLHAAC